jgi:hypothetical protein
MNDIVVRLAAALGVKMETPMGHLDSFAEDVNETVASLNREFESLNARKTKLRERGAEIAGKWSAHFDGQEAALTVAEAALNRISNVPVSTAKKADPPKDQKLSEVQKNG